MEPPIGDCLARILREAPNKCESVDYRLALTAAQAAGKSVPPEAVGCFEERRNAENSFESNLIERPKGQTEEGSGSAPSSDR
jgi:hypothetical protein